VNISAASGAACFPKHRKHVALIVKAEMKETVPRQDAGKFLRQR
jgi:hypothetical protein